MVPATDALATTAPLFAPFPPGEPPELQEQASAPCPASAEQIQLQVTHTTAESIRSHAIRVSSVQKRISFCLVVKVCYLPTISEFAKDTLPASTESSRSHVACELPSQKRVAFHPFVFVLGETQISRIAKAPSNTPSKPALESERWAWSVHRGASPHIPQGDAAARHALASVQFDCTPNALVTDRSVLGRVLPWSRVQRACMRPEACTKVPRGLWHPDESRSLVPARAWQRNRVHAVDTAGASAATSSECTHQSCTQLQDRQPKKTPLQLLITRRNCALALRAVDSFLVNRQYLHTLQEWREAALKLNAVRMSIPPGTAAVSPFLVAGGLLLCEMLAHECFEKAAIDAELQPPISMLRSRLWTTTRCCSRVRNCMTR